METKKTIIYIRHGKDRKNGYRHDEKLAETEESKTEIKTLTHELIEEYGIPDVIYYSPFQRTRRTSKYMIKEIKKLNKKLNSDENKKESNKTQLILEPNLGRYFTQSEKENPEIHRNTLSKNPIINENWKEFLHRIKQQFRTSYRSEYQIIWNVTHTLVLLNIAKKLKIERNPYVEYLDTVVYIK